MEKIFEIKLGSGNSVRQFREKLDIRLEQLKAKFGGDEEMDYSWNHDKRKLLIVSSYFTSEINLGSNNIELWIDVPFLFRPFKGKVVAELTQEINAIINKGENCEHIQQSI